MSLNRTKGSIFRNRGLLFLSATVVLFSVYELVKYACTLIVFGGGEPSQGELYRSTQTDREYFFCEVIENIERKDLTIRFNFEIPLVDFKGNLLIFDDNVLKEGVPRNVYAGPYRKKITIKNLCLDGQRKEGKDMLMPFLFLQVTVRATRFCRPMVLAF